MTYCKAPHTNMYCSVEGLVAPCWLSISKFEKWSEDMSLHNIWFGEKFTRFREENNCCSYTKDFTISSAYDENEIKEYPTMMELELSNQCNFECIMCDERLSSGIRKRKGLPKLPQVYNDDFVEELKEFIPHLNELRFNGGEPLAQTIVYDIIEMALDIKPDLRITVATNGSIINKNVMHWISKGNITPNISIDAFSKDLYEKIRINGDWESLLYNFQVFKHHCSHIAVMVNPMSVNWHEMVLAVDFCNEHGVYLGYNTVRYPKHLSIMHMDVEMLEEAYNTMRKQVDEYPNKNHNWEKFNHLVNVQMKTWLMEQYD